jgi:alkylhydroperoxidase/carboxymuconolactone decarboxylase family protein YurZ
LQPSDEAFTLLLPSVAFISTQGSKDVKMVDQKELLAALEVQHKRDNRPGITKEAVAEIKSSAIFQVNWEDLLKSAPISINALGAALVASSSETATTIEFTPPKGGFKFLQ